MSTWREKVQKLMGTQQSDKPQDVEPNLGSNLGDQAFEQPVSQTPTSDQSQAKDCIRIGDSALFIQTTKLRRAKWA
ncbi:MAG: hypothetical protein U0559_10860 [Anaerolineae bacterium]